MIVTKLFLLAKRAFDKKCVPVGAVIISNGKIIAKAYNLKEKTNNPLDHAEIIAIKKAAKKLKTWKLCDCKLYVTMKPCKMCETVICESRIKEVFFLCENEKENSKKTNIKYAKIGSKNEELRYVQILKNFFKIKRK